MAEPQDKAMDQVAARRVGAAEMRTGGFGAAVLAGWLMSTIDPKRPATASHPNEFLREAVEFAEPLE